jgi:U2 small nuclear ribonucleoprotein B''
MATELAADIAPCRTLYVRNLPDRLPKQKLIELLHAAFSPYGTVLWISAQKTVKLRGQAFVTLADMASATSALRKMHGSKFLGNVVSVQYAKSVSDKAAQDAPGAKKKRRLEKETALEGQEKAQGTSNGDAEYSAQPSASADERRSCLKAVLAPLLHSRQTRFSSQSSYLRTPPRVQPPCCLICSRDLQDL